MSRMTLTSVQLKQNLYFQPCLGNKETHYIRLLMHYVARFLRRMYTFIQHPHDLEAWAI